MQHAVMLLLAVILASGGHAAAPGETQVNGTLGARLDRHLQRATGGGFWGVALVARQGEILLARGYGNADYGLTSNRPDTLFEIASASKQFTAAGILRLEMAGKLQLEDPISRHLEEVPADKRQITILQLLTHTSGISPDVSIPYAARHTREEMVQEVLAAPLASPPGEHFAYCNCAYAVLAAIIELVSQRSFEDFMREEVFRPALLTDTGFIGDPSLDPARAATRLSERTPDATALQWFRGWGYRGMGGVVTTALNLYRWDRALRTDQPLSARARERYLTPHREGYALGWVAGTTARGTAMVLHGGTVEGFGTHIVRYLDEDAVIILLSNGRTELHTLAQGLEAILFSTPGLTLALDVGGYQLSEHRGLVLPEKARWKLARAGEIVTMQLLGPRRAPPLATIQVPLPDARRVHEDLGRLLKEQRPGAGSGLEAGVFLGAYPAAGSQLEIDTGLKLTLLPRYEGVNPDGSEIRDERITLVVSDASRGSWPVMVKMGPRVARNLHQALGKALR